MHLEENDQTFSYGATAKPTTGHMYQAKYEKKNKEASYFSEWQINYKNHSGCGDIETPNNHLMCLPAATS